MAAIQISAGRGLALAILAGLIAAFVLFVILPVGALFAAQNDDIAQYRQLLTSYRAEIASRPQLEMDLAEINRRQAATQGLLQGANAELAAANMQAIVKALVESHGGQIRSVQNLPSVAHGDLEKIQVEYDLSLPLGSLKPVTYKLETEALYLFIGDADIRAGQIASQEGAPQSVDVRWTISGYRWAGGR